MITILQGPMTALLMQQTWSSSQEEQVMRHTLQVNQKFTKEAKK